MDEEAPRPTIDSLRSAPERLASLLARAYPGLMDWKPSAATFSIRENVHHLRDIEIEGYAARLARLLREEDPFLPDIDGDRLASERAYNERPHAPALEEFRRAREESVAILQRLTSDEWRREGILEGIGRVSVERLVALWSRHDEDHLEQVRRLVSEGGDAASP